MQNNRVLNNKPKYKEAMNELLESGEYGILQRNKKTPSKTSSKVNFKRSFKSKKLSENNNPDKQSEISKKDNVEQSEKSKKDSDNTEKK